MAERRPPKLLLSEVTRGLLPLDQTPMWAFILANAHYAAESNKAYNQLKEVTDPTDPQDAATKAYVDGLIGDYAQNGLGLIVDADAACQGVEDWTVSGAGATLTVVTPTSGGSLGPADGTTAADALEFHSDDINQDIDLPSAGFRGGLRAGHHYAIVLAWQSPNVPAGLFVWGWRLVGSGVGAENFTNNFYVTTAAQECGIWRYLVAYIDPANDHAAGDLTFQIYRDAASDAGDVDLLVGYVQAVELGAHRGLLSLLDAGASGQQVVNDSLRFVVGDPAVVAGDGLAHQGYFTLGRQSGEFGNYRAGIQHGDSGGEGSMYHYAEHAPGDVADKGHQIQVGEDYVGIRISEKDAATVQMYPDADGVDVELAARPGGGTWIIDGGGP